MQELTDEQLNAWILARLDALGVDLDVLPEDDAAAPVDRRRILRSARRFLRTVPGAIADFRVDPQEVPPFLYPSRSPGGGDGGGA